MNRILIKGFTFIELVVVLVIVGILAAVAIPIYIDLTKEAETQALTGVAGAIESAAAMNYSSYKANPSNPNNVPLYVGMPCGNLWDIPSIGQTGLLKQPNNMQFYYNGNPENIQDNGNGTGICHLNYTGPADSFTYIPENPVVPVVFLLAS